MSDEPTQSMIYTPDYQYAAVNDADVPAFLAAGWSATPTGDIYTEPTKYAGDLTPPKKGKAKEQ